MKRDWLSRNLVVLTAVSLTQDAASELLYPLLPLLMATVTTAPALLLGITEGLAELTAGLTLLWAGKQSDVRGRRGFITIGYGMAAVGKAVVATAYIWPVMTLGRTLDRFGKGLRTSPRDSLIADEIPKEHLGRAYGFHRAGDTAGAVLGPLIALAGLALLNNDVRAVALWAIIPAALSTGLTLLIRDRRTRSHRSHETTPTQPLGPELRRMIGLLGLIAISNVPDVLLLLRMSDIGVDATGVVLAYVLYNLVASLLSLPAGSISDRIGRRQAYAIGLGAFAAAYLGLGLTDNHIAAFGFMALYGLFPAFTDGVGKAWVSHLADDEIRGKAQGTFKMVQTFGVLIAGTWAGLAWELGDGRGGSALTAAGVLAAVGGIVVLSHKRLADGSNSSSTLAA